MKISAASSYHLKCIWLSFSFYYSQSIQKENNFELNEDSASFVQVQ
jgi:hypothetical protein